MKVKNNKSKEMSHVKWVVLITISAFLLSIAMSFFSERLLAKTNILISFVILIGIILIGILFDVVGVAVTVAEEKPFHSMAAAKVKGAKQALVLIRNAAKVSNFCNDVIGDICGIISGTSAAYIIIKVGEFYSGSLFAFFSVSLSGLVAALTVGGKAMGKEVAIGLSKEIVTLIGQALSIFQR